MQKKSTLTVLAGLFIIVGVVLTLENYSVVGGISKHWPLLIALFGVGFVILFLDRKKEDPVLIWIGIFLLLMSAFFYYLNYTSWGQLVYLWPVFLGIIGISFLSSSFNAKKKIKKVFVYLSIGFIALFLALLLVFTVSLRLWPMSLVVFGLSLLVLDIIMKKKGAK